MMTNENVRTGTRADLTALTNPRSICVIGASPREGHFANTPISNLQRYGFDGGIYPVNPRYDKVHGLECYPSLADLPETPDLAVVVVRPALALDLTRDCAQLGVRAAIVVGSGFAETGEAEGLEHQASLARLSDDSGIRICGPNTLGVANFRDGVVPFASENIPGPPIDGRLAIVSQSGGCSFTLLNRATACGVGVGHVAVAGNEADVTIPELMVHYLRRDDVAAIACYVEAIRDAAGFAEVGALAAELGKPVFVMKSGTSDLGRRAAAAHTGALATNDAVLDASVRRWGLNRAHSFDELIGAAGMAARFGPASGQRFGVYAQGGGLAVVAADLFAGQGVELAHLQQCTVSAIKSLMPDTTPGNPFDSGGQFLSSGASVLTEALSHFVADDRVTAVACFLMPVLGGRLETYSTGIIQALQSTNKPSVVLQYGAGELTQGARTRLLGNGILVLDPPEAGVRALRLWSRSRHDPMPVPPPTVQRLTPRGTPAAARALVERWRADGIRTVTEFEAHPLLRLYGIVQPQQLLITDVSQVAAALADIDSPVAVKISSPDIPHRSDVGGVTLDVVGPDAAVEAYGAVLSSARAMRPDARFTGVTISEMVGGGPELLVGVRVDPSLGPALVLGMGGVFAEYCGEAAIALLPLTRPELTKLIDSATFGPIIRGARRQPEIPLDALYDLTRRIGELATDLSDSVVAAELNPVIWSARHGCFVAADALIELEASGSE
jgi:acyl-CoA synthetase (NDP forming)